MKLLSNILFSLIIFFSVPTFAYAATYYVSDAGNDSNTGSQSSPWKTIGKAAEYTNLTGGDVIIVTGSHSTERVTINKSGSSGAPITFQAQGQVVTKGLDITASHIDIKGFEVANTDSGKPGIKLTGAYNTIENNNIHNSAMYGIWIFTSTATGTNLTTHDNIIRNNNIHFNNSAGMSISGRNNIIEGNQITDSTQNLPGAQPAGDADGIFFFGQGHIIRNNYIFPGRYGGSDYVTNAHVDCFQTWASNEWSEQASNITFEQNYCDNLQFQNDYEKGQGWMMEGNAHDITIRNNIIRAYRGINTTGGSGTQANHLYVYNNDFINSLAFPAQPDVAELTNATYSIFKNNIFYDQKNESIDINGDSTGIVVDYNILYNSDGSLPLEIDYPVLHEIRKNPLFVDTVNKNYHLQSGSPAIKTGINLYAAGIINDFDGNPRPQGTLGFDIGGYQYISDGTSTPSPFPGDLNGDTHVNIFDYNILVANFGHPYTIFDYNILVANFGK